MTTCRFCKSPITDRRDYVKYGVRHYAHPECYLNAGKKIEDLKAWQIGRFPYRVLERHGLLDAALKITSASTDEARAQ